MVKSATLIPPRSDGGFSLVELMIVVFIMSVAATFIILSAPPGKSDVARDSEAILEALEGARHAALLSGQAVAIKVDANQLTTLRRRNESWVANQRDALRFNSATQISFETQRVIQRGNQASDIPEFIFEPIGFARPTEAVLTGDDEQFRISVSRNGAIAMVQETNRAR